METEQNKKEKKQYEVIIIGGGPAGLTAGLYASRAKLNTVLLEKAFAGGQVASTGMVENYPGIKKIGGMELARRMEEQAKEFGLNIEICEVKCLKKEGDQFCVETNSADFIAPAVILTTGVQPRKLGVPGEREYKGKGVSYCAICDGFFYNGKHVAVIGGGDSAVEEGIYLTKFASKVSIIHRRDQLRASKFLQEKAFQNPKIEFIWNSIVKEIKADEEGFVNRLVLENVKTSQISEMQVDGVFIYIGTEPNLLICDLDFETDEKGFLVTDDQMRTSVPGIFAAGDVRSKMLRQIVTAVGDGAIAAVLAEKYIDRYYEEQKKGLEKTPMQS